MRRVLGGAAVAVSAVACLFMSAGAASADNSTFAVVGPLGQDGGISVARCPEGSHLIGGGYRGLPASSSDGVPRDFVDLNAPSETPNAWEARFHKSHVRAVALCERDPRPQP